MSRLYRMEYSRWALQPAFGFGQWKLLDTLKLFATSLNWLVRYHNNSWYVMTCHDRRHGFVTKNRQMSSKVTKYHHVKSPKIFQFNMVTFGDISWYVMISSNQFAEVVYSECWVSPDHYTGHGMSRPAGCYYWHTAGLDTLCCTLFVRARCLQGTTILLSARLGSQHVKQLSLLPLCAPVVRHTLRLVHLGSV